MSPVSQLLLPLWRTQSWLHTASCVIRVQPYCKEKLVSSHGLNQTGIEAIYWFISSAYLTCSQWAVCSGLKSATHQINHSTRHLQNVNKCLQISKHAFIVPTFKSPPPRQCGLHTPCPVCGCRCSACRPSCGDVGAPAVHAPLPLPAPR